MKKIEVMDSGDAIHIKGSGLCVSLSIDEALDLGEDLSHSIRTATSKSSDWETMVAINQYDFSVSHGSSSKLFRLNTFVNKLGTKYVVLSAPDLGGSNLVKYFSLTMDPIMAGLLHESLGKLLRDQCPSMDDAPVERIYTKTGFDPACQ